MCGICGILNFSGNSEPPSSELITRMNNSMAHRGPDDWGVWCDETNALGSRRLSIIDLSRAGKMPMSNEDGTIRIVYNGEVYNFQELKERYALVEKGHVFNSRTDTEVLLHLYEEIGLDMVKHLNGMFAIAIWDGRRNVLNLIRDRYGIKPLFYQMDNNYFRFGSEIKAIIEDERVLRKPNLQALHDYLTFDYIPGQQTAFDGIFEVPPAHWMTIRLGGNVNIERYWDLDFTTDHSIDEKTAIHRAFELMDLSVKRRLIADVPIGVLLSGGMDSSTVVALMNRHTNEPIHTYSVGFEHSSFNELPYARIVAEKFNTIHKEVVITSSLVRDLLPKYLTYIDEPYADGSAIPTYYVCQLAKDEVVVVLSGEGGDEAFAGYETYSAYQVYKWFRRVPKWVRNGLVSPLVNLLPVSDEKLSFEFKLKRFLGGQDLSPPAAHMWWRIVLTESHKHIIYSDDVVNELTQETSFRIFQQIYNRLNNIDPLSKLMYIDSSVFLPDDLMIKNDRMSMAHSLEARVPMTDPELTAFMASVPLDVKFPALRKKHIMRKAMSGILPDEILNKKKVGLEIPYSKWFKDELKDVLTEYLSPKRVNESGLFRTESVNQLVYDHINGVADHGRALWGLLNYMMWMELYIR